MASPLLYGPDGRPIGPDVLPQPGGPRALGRSRRCQNCRHFWSVTDGDDFLTHYAIKTSVDRALRPGAGWKQWDGLARAGLLGVCRAGHPKADFIHAGALCDKWDGRVRFERSAVDILGDEARDRLGDPPEAWGPRGS